ncbi:MAG TPA: glycoside hydrolase family 130 protein [Catenuloplanes sp.]|jgi:predicted GH43/DUF377 family glycosyl hydrolase
MTGSDFTTRVDLTLVPDAERVIVKLFVPGEDAPHVRNRATALIERIAGLPGAEIEALLQQTLRRFGGRHHHLESAFEHNYELVHHRVPPGTLLSAAARRLVGAYFSHEYAVEAAALCNPSMVPHPDQSGLDPGQLRVAMSLRQVGEGHISSIGFATAVIGPGHHIRIGDRSGPLLIGPRRSGRHRRDLLAAGLADENVDNEVAATVLGLLPEKFSDDDFARALENFPAEMLTRLAAPSTLEHVRRALADSYAIHFPDDVPLHQRVLWPAAPAERNGMEDARFVRFVGDDGEAVYHATYTAYDGQHIAARLLTSTDLLHFEVDPLRGPGAANKGMALFPRLVDGCHLAVCRADGETMGLTMMDAHSRWQTPVPLHTPRHSWELIQVGNCGSPIETEAGWLVLTHGVGPMRRYAIGAMLLDLHDPRQVLGEVHGPILAPDEVEREGYVPNVVYSCGGLVHGDAVWVPYGASDARVGVAHADLNALLAAMEPPKR